MRASHGSTRHHRQEGRHDPGLRRRTARSCPVTVIQAGPVPRRADEDRRQGRLRRRPARPRRRASGRSRVNKASRGHFEKAGVAADARRSREFRVDEGDELKAGDKVLCDIVRRAGARRRRSASSKGKGFQGVVKRHHFARRRGDPRLDVPPRARARSARRPSRRASTRACGPRAAWAATRSRSKNLVVVRVDAENNLLYISRRRSGRPQRDRQDRALELRAKNGSKARRMAMKIPRSGTGTNKTGRASRPARRASSRTRTASTSSTRS